MMHLQDIEQAITAAGFVPRGAFHAKPEDGVPDVAPGTSAGTLVLVGNAGPAMWERFCVERDPEHDLLDDWSAEVIAGLASELGATALFPFTKPHLPFQRWAQRAEPCHPSPLGIFIHPDYGLWHSYRGALAFAERLDLPPPDLRPAPCDTCPDKPCLTACPVGAFTGSSYDVAACATHVVSDAGADCRNEGCRARRACPVGREYIYQPPQAQFHMAAFLRARREEGTL